MSDIKVSIIISVNNLEKYLRKSLTSVIKQTLKDIEIICVNDGSKDKSLEILNKFKQEDNRIQVIDVKKQQGQAHARNLALEAAKGEYIGFVDGDDWVEVNMFEKLYEKASKTKSDITMCNAHVFDEKKQTVDTDNNYYSLDVFNETFDKRVFSYIDTLDFILDINVVIWNKLYKTSFLKQNKIKFAQGYIYEDLLFFFDTYLKADKVSIIRDYLYYYRANRSNSTMANVGKKILDRIDMVEATYNLLKQIPVYEEIKPKVFAWVIDDLFHRYTLISSEYQKDYFDRLKILFNKLDNSDINPDFTKNIYYYEEYLLLKDKKYDEWHQSVLNLYAALKEKQDRFISDKKAELYQQQLFYEDMLVKNKASIEDFFKKEFNNQKQFYENELKNNIQAYEAEKQELKTQILNQEKWLKEALEKQKEEIDNWHNNNLEEKVHYYENELNQKDYYYNEQKDQLETDFQHTINSLEAEQKELIDKFEQEKQDLLKQISNQEKCLVEALEKQKEEINSWHNENLIKQLNDQKITYENIINQTKSEHNHYIKEQNIIYANAIKLKEEVFNNSINEQKTYYENEIKLKEEFHSKSLLEQKEQVDSHYLNEIRLKEEFHSKSLLEQKEQIDSYYLNEIRLKEEFHNKNLSEQKSYYENEVRLKEEFFNKNLSDQKINFQSQILSLNDKLNTQIQEAGNSYNALLNQMNEQKSYYETLIQTNTQEKWNELESQKSYYESLIDTNWQNKEKELYEQRMHYENVLYYTKENHDKAWLEREEQFNKQINEMQAAYEKDIKYLKTIIKILNKLRYYYNFAKKELKNILPSKKATYQITMQDRTIPLISVILPVYNVGPYIRQCLDSLINQTVKELEIICINDGSTDDCREILDEYSQKDSRIKVLHKQNEGTGVARNQGLKLATGEYIAFVDPDDWVRENMFERLYQTIIEKDVDIAMCMPAGFDEGEQTEKDFPYFINDNFKHELDNKIFNWETISPFSYPMCVWNKLYKKSLFDENNIDFAEYLDFEDHKVIFKTLVCAKSIYFIREKLYVYRFNRKGSILTDNNARLIDHIRIFDIVEQLLKETNTFTGLRYDFITYKIHNLLYYYSMIKDEHKGEYYSQMLDAIRMTNLSEEEANILCEKYNELRPIIKELNTLQTVG